MTEQWQLRFKDEQSGREESRTFYTEPGFLAGCAEAVHDRWKSDLSAILPSGIPVDDVAIRRLVSQHQL